MQFLPDGTKVRVSKRTGTVVPKSPDLKVKKWKNFKGTTTQAGFILYIISLYRLLFVLISHCELLVALFSCKCTQIHILSVIFGACLYPSSLTATFLTITPDGPKDTPAELVLLKTFDELSLLPVLDELTLMKVEERLKLLAEEAEQRRMEMMPDWQRQAMEDAANKQQVVDASFENTATATEASGSGSGSGAEGGDGSGGGRRRSKQQRQSGKREGGDGREAEVV